MNEVKFFGSVYHMDKEGITSEYLLTEEAYLTGLGDNEFLKMQAIAISPDYKRVMVYWNLYNHGGHDLDDYDYSTASEIRYL